MSEGRKFANRFFDLQYRDEFPGIFVEKCFRSDVRRQWEHLPLEQQKAFLWVVGNRLWIDVLKRLQRRQALIREATESGALASALIDPVTPERIVIAREGLKKLGQYVDPKDIPVLQLMGEETPAEEAALILHLLSAGSYRTKSGRIRAKIKKCEKDEADENGPQNGIK